MTQEKRCSVRNEKYFVHSSGESPYHARLRTVNVHIKAVIINERTKWVFFYFLSEWSALFYQSSEFLTDQNSIIGNARIGWIAISGLRDKVIANRHRMATCLTFGEGCEYLIGLTTCPYCCNTFELKRNKSFCKIIQIKE